MLRRNFNTVILILILTICISSGCSRTDTFVNTQITSFETTSMPTPTMRTLSDKKLSKNDSVKTFPDNLDEVIEDLTDNAESKEENIVIDTNITVDDISYGYYYDQLTNNQKVIYISILENIDIIQDIYIKFLGADVEDIQYAINAIEYEQYKFFVSNINYYDYDYDYDISVKLTLDKKLSLSNIQMKKVENKAKKILEHIDGTDEEIIRKIYNWCTKHIKYDSTLSKKHIRDVYGALIRKTAVCAGYAKAFSYLCNQAGIKCIYLSNKKHAWNYVQLEENWYAVDTTWSKTNSNSYLLVGQDLLKDDDHIPSSEYFSFPKLSDKTLYPDQNEVKKIKDNLEENIKICNDNIDYLQSYEEYDETLCELYIQARNQALDILDKVNNSIFYLYIRTNEFSNDYNELKRISNEIDEY